MKRVEELQKHVDKLKELSNKAKLAIMEFNAYKQAFDSWMKQELQVPADTEEILLPEILLKWSKKNDIESAN